MPPITRSTFRSDLRSLRREEVVAFVADLWSARGFETRVEGDVVVATRPDEADGGGRSERIAVEPGHGRPSSGTGPSGRSEGVDVVVTRDGGGGTDRHVEGAGSPVEGTDVRTLGCDDLYEMLLYSVPRSTAEPIVRRHLGRELTVESTAAPRSAAGWVRGAVDATPTWVSLAVAATVVVLLVAAAAGLPAGDLDRSGGGSGEEATPASLSTTTPGIGSTADPGTEQTERQGTGAPCLDTPAEAVRYQIDLLRTPDGIRTVWERGTHEFRRYAGTYDEFNHSMRSHPFDRLRDPTRIEYGSVARSGPTARQDVTVTGETGREYRYVFTLSLEPTDGERCWRLDGLTYRSD